MELSFLVIAGIFILYILTVLYVEKKIIYNPEDLLQKFLAFMLLYAGISIMYYALTGTPFLNESETTYKTYLFLIGFIAMMWSIPNLLSEFKFFKKYMFKKNHK
jgi:hypothetical protein